MVGGVGAFTSSLVGMLFSSLEVCRCENAPVEGRTSQALQDRQEGGTGKTASGADTLTLSPEAREQLRRLRDRDREVRAHEQAHVAAGGGSVQGAPHYTYQTGPDHRQYAVGGSVSLDASEVPGDPDATAEKARTLRRAALAPANPSGQDLSVAAKASAMESAARTEAMQQTDRLAALAVPVPIPQAYQGATRTVERPHFSARA